MSTTLVAMGDDASDLTFASSSALLDSLTKGIAMTLLPPLKAALDDFHANNRRGGTLQEVHPDAESNLLIALADGVLATPGQRTVTTDDLRAWAREKAWGEHEVDQLIHTFQLVERRLGHLELLGYHP